MHKPIEMWVKPTYEKATVWGRKEVCKS